MWGRRPSDHFEGPTLQAAAYGGGFIPPNQRQAMARPAILCNGKGQ